MVGRISPLGSVPTRRPYPIYLDLVLVMITTTAIMETTTTTIIIIIPLSETGLYLIYVSGSSENNPISCTNRPMKNAA